MSPLDYNNMFHRFGRKLENELMSDFPKDTKLVGEVDDLLTKMTIMVLEAFVRNSVD